MIYLEAWKDGGGADAESEHVGDRGDGDGDSGVLISAQSVNQMVFPLMSFSNCVETNEISRRLDYSWILECIEG